MSGRPVAIYFSDCDADPPQGLFEDVRFLQCQADLGAIVSTICQYANRAQPINKAQYVSDVQYKMERWIQHLNSINIQSQIYSDIKLKLVLV
jgi:hypothetical protein